MNGAPDPFGGDWENKQKHRVQNGDFPPIGDQAIEPVSVGERSFDRVVGEIVGREYGALGAGLALPCPRPVRADTGEGRRSVRRAFQTYEQVRHG